MVVKLVFTTIGKKIDIIECYFLTVWLIQGRIYLLSVTREDCKRQVNGYSHNNYKKFDTPDKAWDFVDQHSSRGNAAQFDTNKAVACRNNNQVAIRGNHQGEARGYQRTDYMVCVE